ncbi:low-complexity tail membrane protein [Thermoleptolyngbya sp. C42_A2020_037]|uniref:low-complexity tail membrane protein n=1 Tax=Thermoleptolyngbya sp. C42_A2020_037 TaxID=2747799 RepID=UPI0019E98D41|nr:low-complexity tail membrane protein [Thermoleptolyngbya sp. C42_A2020_037]MBF2084711.1 low-complexity tail membrane protein [Thermoleptolyngbya sp. C42_A2020_037]
MRSFWSDPYLWVHLAGLAAVPLLAEVCLVGLAVGDPWLPVWLEVLLVGVVGIAPVLWMQWKRPFCIFSLTPLALRPDALSDDRRRMLHLFKGTEVQALAGSAAIALFLLLWQLFRFAPVATEAAATLPQNRALGLLIAAIAFLLCNLFVQVPLSVIRVLLSTDGAIAQFAPYTPDEVAKSFTIPGFRVKQIVPDLVTAAPRVPPAIQRDSRSKPYGNRPQPPSAAPLMVDEALNESPWDESEPSGSQPLAPELTPDSGTPDLAIPEPVSPEVSTPEPPLETSTALPEPFSEAFQVENPPEREDSPESFQPTSVGSEAISDAQASSAPLSDAAAVVSETIVSEVRVSAEPPDGAAAPSDADEGVAEINAMAGAIAQAADLIAQAPEPPPAEATILDTETLNPGLDLGDDFGSGIAAGLDALDSLDAPDSTPELPELIDASATELTPELTHDSAEPQTLEIVDASALLANQSIEKQSIEKTEETPEGAIAPEQNSLEEPSDPISADTLDLNVEALVAEALEAVDAELLRELPDPLTDVSLTDDAASEFESPECPPAENP